MKSGTLLNSRPSTPQNGTKTNNESNNRDTLMNNERKTSDYLSTSSCSSSTKRSPTVSVITSSSLPTNQNDPVELPSPPANDKTRKQLELSPKPPRAHPPVGQFPPSPTTTRKANMGKDGHSGTVTGADLSQDDRPPVQRLKSKFHRRKLTEEEAVKELGLLFSKEFTQHSRSIKFVSEPIAARDDPISRYHFKKKLGAG